MCIPYMEMFGQKWKSILIFWSIIRQVFHFKLFSKICHFYCSSDLSIYRAHELKWITTRRYQRTKHEKLILTTQGAIHKWIIQKFNFLQHKALSLNGTFNNLIFSLTTQGANHKWNIQKFNFFTRNIRRYPQIKHSKISSDRTLTRQGAINKWNM